MKPKKQQPSQVLTLDQIKEAVKDLLSEQDKRFDKKLQIRFEENNKEMDKKFQKGFEEQEKKFYMKLKNGFNASDKRMDRKFQKARKDQSKVMFEYFVTKDEFYKEISELKELIKYLPSTELYLSKMAELVGEQQTLRNNDDILNNRTSTHTNKIDDHEERITNLEQLPILTA